MKDNKTGFSIIFSIIFVVLISLLVIYILEFILPFARDTKSVENSSASFYESMRGVEDSLLFAKENELVDSGETQVPNSDTVTSLIANTSPTRQTLPMPGEGNSDYDKEFNIINAGNPIQLEVGNERINHWPLVELKIQAPDVDYNNGSDNLYNHASYNDTVLINWQLSSSGNTLSADGNSFITSENIRDSKLINNTVGGNQIKGLIGIELDGTISTTMKSFYDTECTAGKKCTLKFSVVNELLFNATTKLPYLEWQIDFGTTATPSRNFVPTRFYRITSVGKVGAFRKILEVQKPQQTVIQAFDFTVIQ